jgi:hypothetical protein
MYFLLAVVSGVAVYLFRPFGLKENRILGAGLTIFFIGCGVNHIDMLTHGLEKEPINLTSAHHAIPTIAQVIGAMMALYVVFPAVMAATELAITRRKVERMHKNMDKDKPARAPGHFFASPRHAQKVRAPLVGYLVLVAFVFFGFVRMEDVQQEGRDARQTLCETQTTKVEVEVRTAERRLESARNSGDLEEVRLQNQALDGGPEGPGYRYVLRELDREFGPNCTT